jgi:putative flippase GtrA
MRLAPLLKFAAVGVVAAGVDMAVVEAMIRIAGFDPYSARLVSYLAAATTAWALNRRYTFHAADRSRPLRQWLRYLGTNALGGAVNYALYAALVSAAPLFAAWPFLAVAAGSLAGLVFNYAVSQRYVFRASARSLSQTET